MCNCSIKLVYNDTLNRNGLCVQFMVLQFLRISKHKGLSVTTLGSIIPFHNKHLISSRGMTQTTQKSLAADFDRMMFVFKGLEGDIMQLNGEFELQLTIAD